MKKYVKTNVSLNFQKYKNFFSISGIITIFAIVFVLIMVTTKMFTMFGSKISTKSFEIKYYSTQEALDVFVASEQDKNKSYEDIRQLGNRGAIFTYKFIDQNFIGDGKTELIRGNIKNYNGNKIEFNQESDSRNDDYLNLVFKIKNKYAKFGNLANKLLYQTEPTIISLLGSKTSKRQIRNLYTMTGDDLKKISCLNNSSGDKWTINDNGTCKDVGYYVALKEFIVEETDKNIAFPLTVEIDGKKETILIKKFENEGKNITNNYMALYNFLEEKDLLNMFFFDNGPLTFGEKGLFNGIKKGIYYESVFDGIFGTTDANDLGGNNIIDIISEKRGNSSNNGNSEKKDGGQEENSQNTSENGKKGQFIDGGKELVEDDGSYRVTNSNSYEIDKINYEITKDVVNKLTKSSYDFFSVFYSDESLASFGGFGCNVKHGKKGSLNTYYIKYTDVDCDDIISIVNEIGEKEGILGSIGKKIDGLTSEEIGKVNFVKPAFGFSIYKGGAGFRLVGIQKGKTGNHLSLKKFYSPTKVGLGGDNVGKLSEMLGILYVFLYLFFYTSFYIGILAILTLLIGYIYDSYGKKYGIGSKKE